MTLVSAVMIESRAAFSWSIGVFQLCVYPTPFCLHRAGWPLPSAQDHLDARLGKGRPDPAGRSSQIPVLATSLCLRCRWRALRPGEAPLAGALEMAHKE